MAGNMPACLGRTKRMTDKYAVIGNPIAHSKSPFIHLAFATQTGQDISYERILAPLDGFEATILELIKKNYKGVNVTVPFKFEALKFVSQHGVVNPLALTAGAINTIRFSEDGSIIGDNTDGIGLMNDIAHNLKFDIRHKKVLLLGSGGAAFGILQPLLNANPSLIVISNRTLSKAQEAAKIVSGLIEASQTLAHPSDTTCMAQSYEDLGDTAFDLVINSTSTGLTDTALPIPNTIFAKNCLAYDMMYGRETPFMQQARASGAQVADGLGMLVEQAAEAFYLWRAVRPETHSVMQQIRALS
jgi:shikimate dehydrogenase